MVVEKASDKAIRVSAMEDGNINLYLIMVSKPENLEYFKYPMNNINCPAIRDV